MGRQVASATGGSRAGVRPAIPAIVGQVLRSPGRPLDAAARGLMEARFGHDFGNVRVHADDRAAESARAVNAKAYAVGNDIVFNRGEYQPRSAAGLRSLAHELTHVMQQTAEGTRAVPDDLRVGAPQDTAEREAAQVGLGSWPRAGMSVQEQPCLRRQPADPDTERRLQELERRAAELKARSRRLRERVQKTADDLGLQKGDPSDFQKLVTNLFPGKAHRVAGYVFDEALGGLKTDLSSKPIIHFGQAFLKLPLTDQQTALAVELDKVDQWCVDHGQIEAVDLSDIDITDRIRGLSGAKLAQLVNTVQDPAVKTYVESLRTMTTPLEFGLTRQGTGDARTNIGNVAVNVRPDVSGDQSIPRGEAKTFIDANIPADLRPFVRDNGTTVTRVDPIPVTITIQTRYGPGANPDSPSNYGRGTTQRDIAVGARSLRFHEGSHGLDMLKFLHENPFPTPAIRVGMNPDEVENARGRFQQDRRDYLQRLERFSEQQTHCVGITVDQFHHKNSVCGGGHP